MQRVSDNNCVAMLMKKIVMTGLQHTKHWYGPLKVTFSYLCKLCIYDSTETMDGKRHVCHFHIKVTDKWQFSLEKWHIYPLNTTN